MRRLENKVIVITGASNGIGLASAKLFVAHGAYVYITGRSQDTLDKAVAAIGSNITAIKSDVSNLKDIDHLMSEVQSAHGRIDVLFSNVGIAQWEPLGHISEASFDALFTSNVKGTVFLVQKLYR